MAVGRRLKQTKIKQAPTCYKVILFLSLGRSISTQKDFLSLSTALNDP